MAIISSIRILIIVFIITIQMINGGHWRIQLSFPALLVYNVHVDFNNIAIIASISF